MRRFCSLTSDELASDSELCWPADLFNRASEQAEIYLREGIAPRILVGCEAEDVWGFVTYPEPRSLVVSASWPVAPTHELREKLGFALLHAIRSRHPAYIVTMLEQRIVQGESSCEAMGGFELMTSIAHYELDCDALKSSSHQHDHDPFHSDARLKLVSCDEPATRDLLEQTMQDSLDCPELRPFVTWEERLAEYRRLPAEKFRVETTVLEGHEGPLGVAISTSDLERNEWQLGYLGILPEARGQGWGKELLHRLLHQVSESSLRQAGVSVDARNSYAVRIYEDAGFQLSGEFRYWISYWDSLF